MKETLFIRLYADSLGLPRKGYVTSDERYISLLVDWLQEKTSKKVRVVDNSNANSVITTIYSNYIQDNTYYEEADILLIHEGVCDCAPRPIPLRLRNLISRLPSFIRNRIVQIIHNNRAFLQKRGFRYHLVKKQLFYTTYLNWLRELANTRCQVFIFGIAPTNDLIEKQSPGFRDSIENYNLLIQKAVNEVRASNIHFFDTYHMINELNDIDEYVIKEDGHHITRETHKLYFTLIQQSGKFE